MTWEELTGQQVPEFMPKQRFEDLPVSKRNPSAPAPVPSEGSKLNLPLTALLLGIGAGGVHPWGHVSTGGKLGIPMSIDYSQSVENWQKPTTKPVIDPLALESPIPQTGPAFINPKSPKAQTETHGGGFTTQDVLARAMQGTGASREQDLANALYKLWYMFGFPGDVGKSKFGDVSEMTRESGNPLTAALLGASAANQLYSGLGGPKPSWWPSSVDFSTFGMGAPGLKLNWRY